MRIAETRLAAGWIVVGLLIPPASCQPLAEATLRRPVSPLLLPRAPAPRPAPRPRILSMTRHGLIAPIPKETRAYRRTFSILLSRPETTDRYDEMILRHAAARRLDPRLVKALIAAESEFDPGALSPSGARGLMQLMPATAGELGFSARELSDPERNIAAGTAYLEVLFKTAWRKFNLKGVSYQAAPTWLVQRVLAAYNAGPRHLDRPHRLSPGYVQKILVFYRSRVTDIRRASILPPSPALACSSPHLGLH